MSNFLQSVSENVLFVFQFLGIVVVLFVIAAVADKLIQKKNGIKEKSFTTRKIAIVGMFSAIAAILMIFQFSIPFIAPAFYQLDFSEVPALVATFAFGPVAGIFVEFCKILLHLVITGTTTVFVGELANFAVGCSMILPAAIIYEFKKNKKNAILSVAVGTICMTIFGTVFNAVYLLPAFAKLYGMDLNTIIGYGTAINPSIKDLTTFVIIAVAPINLLKGTLVSIITMLIYKPLSPIIKAGNSSRKG